MSDEPWKDRQTAMLALLMDAGEDGLTWREAAAKLEQHHGQVSGTLSVLHQRGEAVRLQERRGGCGVYVLAPYQFGRPEAVRRSQKKIDADSWRTLISELRMQDMDEAAELVGHELERQVRDGKNG